MEVPLFNLILKDGTLLQKCSIFKVGEDDGYVVIEDREEAESDLLRYPWGNYWRKIHFQNKMLNGHITGESLKEFEFVEMLKVN